LDLNFGEWSGLKLAGDRGKAGSVARGVAEGRLRQMCGDAIF
jgi:hypothetical protein